MNQRALEDTVRTRPVDSTQLRLPIRLANHWKTHGTDSYQTTSQLEPTAKITQLLYSKRQRRRRRELMDRDHEDTSSSRLGPRFTANSKPGTSAPESPRVQTRELKCVDASDLAREAQIQLFQTHTRSISTRQRRTSSVATEPELERQDTHGSSQTGHDHHHHTLVNPNASPTKPKTKSQSKEIEFQPIIEQHEAVTLVRSRLQAHHEPGSAISPNQRAQLDHELRTRCWTRNGVFKRLHAMTNPPWTIEVLVLLR
ncbi:hypothetical protein FNV43_RR19884 [Rhamnella rubrinervis]|uniref:Uncharacterized protein n=1 Tax=Rhamnella rubrinervis TaxID=2594499 RepID=A0A8K0DYP0_9ROSA|nr:hypothetical protein FNV43_RR19884 [Rhamnella rubrinervis]